MAQGLKGFEPRILWAYRANVAQNDVAGRLLAVPQRAKVRCGRFLHSKQVICYWHRPLRPLTTTCKLLVWRNLLPQLQRQQSGVLPVNDTGLRRRAAGTENSERDMSRNPPFCCSPARSGAWQPSRRRRHAAARPPLPRPPAPCSSKTSAM